MASFCCLLYLGLLENCFFITKTRLQWLVTQSEQYIHGMHVVNYYISRWGKNKNLKQSLAHMPGIVQCQSDCCSLSRYDGAVFWQTFEPAAASCLTILEMMVDDHRCPHSLIKSPRVTGGLIVFGLFPPPPFCQHFSTFWENPWS